MQESIPRMVCPGTINFWEFLPVKKCFDFQNQMQPQFCISIASSEMNSKKTKPSLLPGTDLCPRAPTRNRTSSFLTSCGTNQGCPVYRNDSRIFGAAAELKGVLEHIFSHFLYSWLILSNCLQENKSEEKH